MNRHPRIPDESRLRNLVFHWPREARAVAALKHPNIVTIHAVEHDVNTTFEEDRGRYQASAFFNGVQRCVRLIR